METAAASALERMELKEEEGEVEMPNNNANEDILDDEDDGGASTSTTSSEGNAASTDADACLIQAASAKDEGNDHFKQGRLDQAARSYRRGCNALKKLNNHAGEEQVQCLLVALHTNLSMVSFKQQKFKVAVHAAAKGLAIQPHNVKLLYRRAVAYRACGELDDSRADLRLAVKLEPSNAACRKELLIVKKEMESSKENQKKALAKAFSSSSFLYQDKEMEEHKKAQAAQRAKEEAQLEFKKRKAQWEDECVKRMANNQPAVSFEDWEKELEEAANKAKAKKEKEQERKRREEMKLKRESRKMIEQQQNDSDDDDDDELTEQELAMMRGYKKTKDGRTTSYFTRELPEHEKQALAQNLAPKRLDSTANISIGSEAETTNATVNATAPATSSNRPSAWNAAGTWEEKDTTTWCTQQLRKRLLDTHYTTTDHEADIVSVEELTGHASYAFAGGKKRYIFDFHGKLKYEFKCDDSVVCSGVVRLPDICSTSHDEVEVAYEASYSQSPSSDRVELAASLKKSLADELRVQIQNWVRDFNEMY